MFGSVSLDKSTSSPESENCGDSSVVVGPSESSLKPFVAAGSLATGSISTSASRGTTGLFVPVSDMFVFGELMDVSGRRGVCGSD